VLASDCTGKYEIAVLAREERGNKITTVIYNKDKIVMDPAAKKVRFYVFASLFTGLNQALRYY